MDYNSEGGYFKLQVTIPVKKDMGEISTKKTSMDYNSEGGHFKL